MSCLLVAPSHVETLTLVRGLHGGGVAVLEREPNSTAMQLAISGEFDLVAWFVDPLSAAAPVALAQLASCGVPVIAVFDDASPELVAESLAAGADACLACSTDARVLVAQVRAVLRRAGAYDAKSGEISGLLQVGDLTVDVDRCEVQRAGAFVALTASEYRIVEFMARHAGRVLKPHEILNAVSDDYEYLPREAQDVLKVYVRRIRRKLEPDENQPRYLVTARGFGYRLEGGVVSPALRSAATIA
ncbi:MAG: response regulator transcription factor [Dehalococcoidia bacterium]|nr:response regulator transcription factor [Dehalococcoidia bacterium]